MFIFVVKIHHMQIENLFTVYKEQQLYGRYITLSDIQPLLNTLSNYGNLNIIGKSVLGNSIYSFTIGSGNIRILMWSQMHGNESTTTKALFDFLNVLKSDTEEAKILLENFTFCTIPMLNPDGALAYTRENANEADLNRDFCNLTQPESKLLFDVFKEFKPDYCYNLHDQRTIYAVGDSGKPATVSFLAPSYNDTREVNETRTKAINVIAAMNEALQQIIPGQVGRFDDSFNINCAGDTFQYNSVPTILFEAGHFPNDYDREETRRLIFVALLSGLKYIYDNVVVDNRIMEYLNIPQNKMNFYDFVYKNVKINYDGNEFITNFASQYKEVLVGSKIVFVAFISDIGSEEIFYGHVEYDAKNELFRNDLSNIPRIEEKADFFIGNMEFINGQSIS